MTYEEVLDWLYRQLPMFQRTGPVRYRIDLQKTHDLCAALGHPEQGLQVIHIAGTNGKGSVSHAVAAALTARGLKTGLYTSPHLEDPRERIRVFPQMRGAVQRGAGQGRRRRVLFHRALGGTGLPVRQASAGVCERACRQRFF